MIFVVIPSILIVCIFKIACFPNKAIQDTVSTVEPTIETTSTPVPTIEPTSTSESTTYSDTDFSDPNSILVIANKKHKLPDNYQPTDLVVPNISEKNAEWTLRQEAATALETMFNEASAQGISLVLGSGFRSQSSQEELYNYYVNINGQEYADSISSRPGYSEHQTGLAVDICNGEGTYDLDKGFIDTAEGQWLYNNAYKYGFILRYPDGKQDITGYDFEPWHYRYVGTEVSTAIYSISPNETFEEYFNLEGGNYE